MAEIDGNDVVLDEVHCVKCGRFLGFAAIAVGVAQFRCKCNSFTTISSFPDGVDNGGNSVYDSKSKG